MTEQSHSVPPVAFADHEVPPVNAAQTRPVWGFLVAALIGGYLQPKWVGANGHSLYTYLTFFYPVAGFLIATTMAAVALGITLGVVGGPLLRTQRFNFWPLLGGAVTLAMIVYVGLPLWLKPSVHGELLPFLARSMPQVAIIAVMVCCYWLVRQSGQGAVAAMLRSKTGWVLGGALVVANVVFSFTGPYWYGKDLQIWRNPFLAAEGAITEIATSLITGNVLWYLFGRRISGSTSLTRGIWCAALGAVGTVFTVGLLTTATWVGVTFVAIVNNQPIFAQVLVELLLAMEWAPMMLCGIAAGVIFSHIAERAGWLGTQPLPD